MQLGSRFQLLSVGYVFVVVLIVKPLGANEFFGSDVPDMFLQGVALRVPWALLRGLIVRKVSLCGVLNKGSYTT